MKKLQQVGVTSILVASLAAGGVGTAAAATPRTAKTTTSARAAQVQRQSVYQRRLSFLSAVLETDTASLELALTRLANQKQL